MYYIALFLQNNSIIKTDFFSQKPTSSVSPIYQTSSTKVQPVQPQVLNSVAANQAAPKESKQPIRVAAAECEQPIGPDRVGSPPTVGKPALPPKPPPPLIKTCTPPPPPRQSAYHNNHHHQHHLHLPQYHQPDPSSEDGGLGGAGGGRAYYTADSRTAPQQKDLTPPPPRIPNGGVAGPPVKSGLGNLVDSSESDNSSSSASMRSTFGSNAK